MKTLSAAELTSHIGYWMRLVSNSVSHAFARRLEASGVTVAEWVVLRQMYGSDDSTNPSAIADLTGLTRGAISKLIARLIDKGLVHQRSDTEDRRYQDIKLTAKAHALVPKLAALADGNDEEFFAPLGKTERKTLTELLQKLAHAHELKRAPIE
jgi:DNA-binding MarR family transcriptional regulator